MGFLKKIKSKLGRNSSAPLAAKTDITYTITGEIGSHEILLPPDHQLPNYQSSFKLYDKKLIRVAKTIFEQLGGICIDIGANVGDTAVAIRMNTGMPIVCIEGDPVFFEYLKKNTASLASIDTVNAFVGDKHTAISGELVKNAGTGRIMEAAGDKQISFLPLEEIMEIRGLNFKEVTLLKTDTDGYDFNILLAGAELILNHKPALFFEYEVNSGQSHTRSLEVITMLSGAGYKFIVYDNFGNFFSSVATDFVQRFTEMNAYIKSCLLNNGGIFYIDVFATVNETIFQQVLKDELDTY